MPVQQNITDPMGSCSKKEKNSNQTEIANNSKNTPVNVILMIQNLVLNLSNIFNTDLSTLK